MKTTECLLFLALLLLGVACGTKTETKNTVAVAPVPQEEVAEPGVQAAKTWLYTQTVSSGGKKFDISLERKADSTLQIVKDGDGLEYLDNKVSLRVAVDGAEKFNKVFTKQSFKGHIAGSDLQRSILHGIAFDQIQDGLLHFGAQVGYPDEAENYYFVLRIDQNGGIAIIPGELPNFSPEV